MAVHKSSASQVVSLVLAVLFGVIILALTYAAAIQSTEQRSRAAESSAMIYKQWEFNGSTTEGWTATNFSNVQVAEGFLRAVYGKPAGKKNPNCNDYACQNRLYSRSSGLWMITDCNNVQDPNGGDQLCNASGRIGSCGGQSYCCPGAKQKWTTDMTACSGNTSVGPGFVNSSVATTLPLGNKYLKLRLGVKDQSRIVALNRGKPSQGIGMPFTLVLTYTVNGGPAIKPLQVQGAADGTLREYTVQIPEIASERIDTLRLAFMNLTSGAQIQIDWILLLGERPRLTPTPTPCVSIKAVSISIQKYCTSDQTTAYYAQYTCSNGASGLIGDGKTCQSVNSLRLQAEAACAKLSKCPTPSGSTGGPVPSYLPPPPAVTPTPTPICVTQCDNNNNCRTVCYGPVSTSIPTPTSTSFVKPF